MATKGNAIFLVYADVDSTHDEELNAWYNTEHLPDLLKLPGFLSAARYAATKGGPKYLAAYELASADGAREGVGDAGMAQAARGLLGTLRPHARRHDAFGRLARRVSSHLPVTP